MVSSLECFLINGDPLYTEQFKRGTVGDQEQNEEFERPRAKEETFWKSREVLATISLPASSLWAVPRDVSLLTALVARSVKEREEH